MKHTTKCVLYARYSPRPTDKLANLATADQQLDACRKYAKEKGYEILGEFLDEQVSRDAEIKPQLDMAIGSIRRGQVLVIAKPDRIGGGFPAASLYNYCDTRKIRIEAVEGGLNGDSPEAKMIRDITAIVTQYEQRIIKKRTSTNMRYRQSKGQKMSNLAPTGFKAHPADPSKWVVDRKESAIVQEICAMYDQGLRAPTITKMLNERGSRLRDNPWNRCTVRRILIRNEKMTAVA
ncbi:MAG: recombinase family protein [Pseudomonadales bacterium]|nr:recombinase family protein [Pseudomonadales bacterium]